MSPSSHSLRGRKKRKEGQEEGVKCAFPAMLATSPSPALPDLSIYYLTRALRVTAKGPTYHACLHLFLPLPWHFFPNTLFHLYSNMSSLSSPSSMVKNPHTHGPATGTARHCMYSPPFSLPTLCNSATKFWMGWTGTNFLGYSFSQPSNEQA